MSHPNTYPALYDYYPDMGSNPLRNRKRIIEFYGTLQAEDISVLGRNTGKYLFRFSGFTILGAAPLSSLFRPRCAQRDRAWRASEHEWLPQCFTASWKATPSSKKYTNGTRTASLRAQATNPTLTSRERFAAVPLVWAMFEKASEVTDDVLVMDLPTFKAAYVPFLSACYVLCGAPDGERLCNVPLMHSVDFARVYDCPVGSPMNPAKKCVMSPLSRGFLRYGIAGHINISKRSVASTVVLLCLQV
ncbi:hypothetical protein HPB48_007783 [Haemaphysalis longicornis]|uniref:Uncharacterized protein n=1 Tax=Haemaphysalis longicornis TaxID=44386 RepID=A0A9J6GB83_HAELO|nr:hypothetical protein HPB48_007783 [Haemaphysalis longicornis]